MLAPFAIDEVEIMTCRGSHGSQALRSLNFGAKSVHKSLANQQGHLSKDVVCAMKPSFREPLEQGVPFDVIPWELAVAVPKLMEMMARVGNSGNDAFQEQTTLQICARIHKLACARIHKLGSIDWKVVAVQAAIGNGGNAFEGKALQLTDFVQVWSGGKDGAVLRDLELYEKSLTVKRKLHPGDLSCIAALGPMHDCARYIPALVKSMLNSPTMDQTEHCNLFSTADFSSLSKGGKNRQRAVEAHQLMQQASTFLQAYGRLDMAQQNVLVSKLEVRCCMFLHSKKASNRKDFSSLQEIAQSFWEEALLQDSKLPRWVILDEKKAAAPAEKATHGSLREINFDGTIANSELEARNFVAGKVVKNEFGEEFKIRLLHPNLKTVVLRKLDEDADVDDAEEEEDEAQEEDPALDVEIDRSTFLSKWQVVVVPAKEFLTIFPDPATNSEMISGVVRGSVMQSLLTEFGKTSEHQLTLMVQPRLAVFSKKKFNVGQLKLVPMTHAVFVLPSVKPAPTGTICIGSVFDFKVYLKSSLQLKANASFRFGSQPQFVVKYWAVHRTVDARKINCEQKMHPISIKVGKDTAELSIPFLTNCKVIEDESELVFLKADDDEPMEPPPKRQKPEAKTKPKAKPKAKVAAKAKAKGKGK